MVRRRRIVNCDGRIVVDDQEGARKEQVRTCSVACNVKWRKEMLWSSGHQEHIFPPFCCTVLQCRISFYNRHTTRTVCSNAKQVCKSIWGFCFACGSARFSALSSKFQTLLPAEMTERIHISFLRN